MKFLEEQSMNAFPSLQTVLYDGWILRFADGYSNRSNSVNPIYSSSLEIREKMSRCEEIFRGRNLKPTYKITPFVSPADLDVLLEKRGYGKIHPTSVQTLSLAGIGEPSLQSVSVQYEMEEDWFEDYCGFNHLKGENRAVCKKILGNIIPMKYFVSLFKGEKRIACGMAVIENHYVGLFDISVAEEHRNCGYGMQLLLNMLQRAKTHGAEHAYLQVMLHNVPALRLYEKLGFEEVYQYHYRVLSDPEIIHTDSKNPDFVKLIHLLDEDLAVRYGEIQKQYEKHNRVDFIQDVVLIYKDNVPVACGAFKAYDQQTIELKRMFVAKECRNQGLAGRIVQKLEELARSKGYLSAVLETGIRQPEAIHLYERLGYQRIPNYGAYAGNTNSVCMKKKL